MSMILERLVETDRKAQAMVEEAEELLESTIANMDREVEAYKESYAERARHRIGVVRDEEGKASQAATEDISSRYGQLMEALEKTYEENYARWEDELFRRVIGGQEPEA